MKALIVIDMPDDAKLDEWFAKIQLDRMRVPISEMYGVIFDKTKVLNFVPLRPMPKKRPLESGSITNTFKESTKYKHIGYNTCLDEILGETE